MLQEMLQHPGRNGGQLPWLTLADPYLARAGIQDDLTHLQRR
jgi:hypothetical protein